MYNYGAKSRLLQQCVARKGCCCECSYISSGKFKEDIDKLRFFTCIATANDGLTN